MNKKILLLIIVIIIYSFVVKADLQCTITTGSCTGVVPFSLYSTTNPKGSHVALGDGYANKVCCTGIDYLGVDCGRNYEILMRLYKTGNSHAAQEDIPGLSSLIEVCLSTSDEYALECGYAVGQTCEIMGYETCLATMNLGTNAHMTSCDNAEPYSTSICCTASICEPTIRECSVGECVCDNGQYMCIQTNQTCLNYFDGTSCETCNPPLCTPVDSSLDDFDDDNIDNECDWEGIQDEPFDRVPLYECNDLLDNDGNGLIDSNDPGCNYSCTTCDECGGGETLFEDWFNRCDPVECSYCGNCLYKDGIDPIFNILNDCCLDKDVDNLCDGTDEDKCLNLTDGDIDDDLDGIPDNCDPFLNDRDNDGSPDNRDCWPDNDELKEGNLSGYTESCGSDGCRNGTYFDFTDCEENCSNGQLVCECNPAVFPDNGLDADNDGYEYSCDSFRDDPCSKELSGDNCDFQICTDDVGNCSYSCRDYLDSDTDDIPDICDDFINDRDNDGTADEIDCYPDDPLIGDNEPCGTIKICGEDGCREGTYFEFTDCDEICGFDVDGVCDCRCDPATFPFDGLDDDRDGYDNGCDYYPNDPCSKEYLGDNCSTELCINDIVNFCNNSCPDIDSDGDGRADVCDYDPGDPCSINDSQDNCGGQSCLEKSNIYCNNCSSLSDSDGDGLIDKCDSEGAHNGPDDQSSLEECSDGIDNDGDGLLAGGGCDEFGCICSVMNNYCGTWDSSITALDPDPSCAELCDSCEGCGGETFDFNFCDRTECEQSCGNCHFVFGLGILNDCCNDSDADTVCDEYDLCPDKDDRVDTDRDGMPDQCDYCANEPALTIPSEMHETICMDGVDNDCDGSTDSSDDDCQCPAGTVRCSDGTCSDTCDTPLICDNDGTCDPTESCNCEDCWLKQGSCGEGTICNPETGLCSGEPDLSKDLCENYDPSAFQGTCNVGETNCWAAEIPADYTIIGDVRCCGDDPGETWIYESNIDLEYILVEYSCYDGEWRDLREIGITYYGIGIE